MNHNKEKWGFYVGSFDPFHIGHYEVVSVLHNFLDKIYILPNNPNKGKPLRTNLDLRIHIIKLSFLLGSLKKVIIETTQCDEFMKSVPSNIIKVGILGSDQYENLISNNQKPKLQVDEWYIVPRHKINLKNSNNFELKVNFLDKSLFIKQEFSSTFIRNEIFKKNYKDLPLVCNDSLNYIYVNNLYSKNDTLKKEAQLYYKDYCKIVTIKENIVMVIDNETLQKKLILKLIDNKLDYDNLLRSELIFEKFGINYARIDYVITRDQYMILVTKYLGKNIEELINDNIRDGYYLGHRVGIELRKLHKSLPNKVTKDLLEQNVKINKLKKLALNNQHLDELIVRFFNNPGDLSLVHGDASVLNFLINEDNQFYFVDIGTVSNYHLNGISFGISCYEYYQFISSIFWKIKDKSKANKIYEGFVNSYPADSFTKEANELFEYYWQNYFFICI